MALLNYTTTISADRTAAEIQKILALHGAKRVSLDFENGEVNALTFEYEALDQRLYFRLPANIDGIYSVLQKQKRARQITLPDSKITHAHARRVAWRILKDWTEAQMALIEAQQARLEEIFLPFMTMGDNRPFFQHYEEKALKMLSEGK